MLGARTHAAMVLALRGDEAARASLVEQANDPAPPRSAPAVLRLAYLADPDGVAPARSLLATTDEEALGTALDACAAYGAAALVEPLLEVARRGRSELSADALTIASAITGASIDDLVIDLSAIGEVIVDVRARDRAILRSRTALGELDRSLRYRGGRPLSLAILADDLTSPHFGPHTHAGWGLPAITGEDHGLVVGDDLIANADAVAAWQGRAHAIALAPGGWARRGVPIEPPGLP